MINPIKLALIGTTVVILSVIAGLVMRGPACSETLTEHAEYVMTDADSKMGAHDNCIAMAKQQALTAAGSLVQSDLQITTIDRNGVTEEVAKRVVKSFVSGLAKGELLQEHWYVSGARLVVTCDVLVTFDPAQVKQDLAVKAKSGLSVKLEDRIREIDELRKRLDKVQYGWTQDMVIEFVGEPVDRTPTKLRYPNRSLTFNQYGVLVSLW